MTITIPPNDTDTGVTETTDTERTGRRATSRVLRLLAGLMAAVALVALSGVTYQAAAATLDGRRHPAHGVLVDVGDHQLHLWCTGSGTPTVVLESGLGGFSHDWSHLRREVATDLQTLLAGAGEDGPFIIVGHSIGGLYARSFARHYPDEVAGIVLVDSSHENQAMR